MFFLLTGLKARVTGKVCVVLVEVVADQVIESIKKASHTHTCRLNSRLDECGDRCVLAFLVYFNSRVGNIFYVQKNSFG